MRRDEGRDEVARINHVVVNHDDSRARLSSERRKQLGGRSQVVAGQNVDAGGKVQRCGRGIGVAVAGGLARKREHDPVGGLGLIEQAEQHRAQMVNARGDGRERDDDALRPGRQAAPGRRSPADGKGARVLGHDAGQRHVAVASQRARDIAREPVRNGTEAHQAFSRRRKSRPAGSGLGRRLRSMRRRLSETAPWPSFQVPKVRCRAYMCRFTGQMSGYSNGAIRTT
jgi:hypothetical protein